MNEQVASCADGVLCFLCFTAAILLLTNEKTISADFYLRGKSKCIEKQDQNHRGANLIRLVTLNHFVNLNHLVNLIHLMPI